MGWPIQNLPQTASGVWVRCVHSGAMEQGPDRRRRIAIGSDHAGYELKQHLVTMLLAPGLRRRRPGHRTRRSRSTTRAICAGVGRTVRDGDADVGIVLGGSGQGEQLAANKVRGVRAALCNCLYTARMARAHNDANVLSIGARVVGEGLAEEIVAHVPHHRVRGRTSRPPRRPDHRTRSPLLTNCPVRPVTPDNRPERTRGSPHAVPLRHRSRHSRSSASSSVRSSARRPASS